MKKYIAVLLALLMIGLTACSSNKDKPLSSYNLKQFTERYNSYAEKLYNKSDEKLKSRRLRVDTWVEGTRGDFQTYSQVVEDGVTIELLFIENKLQGVMSIDKYEESDASLVIFIILYSVNSNFSANNTEETNKIVDGSNAVATHWSMTSGQVYDVEYDGNTYGHLMRASEKTDYYFVISNDYYSQFHL